MRAAVITAPGEVEVTTVADPTPLDDEVVLEVASCGLCGTDLHLIDGHLPAPEGLIPGHELAGTVVAVGAAVHGLAVGDRVAADPNEPCGGCRPCRRGRRNLCERYDAVGVTKAGAAADLVAVRGSSCVRLPAGIDLADASLIEPLACAVRGFDVLQLPIGDRVLVYGAGTMGLVILALARHAGAASVDVVDRNVDRLPTATAMGAHAVAASADDLPGSGRWDAVIDCTGVVAAIEDGLGRVDRGGTFLQFGVAPTEATASWSPFRIYRDEIRIVGSMAVHDSFDRAADLFAAGVVDPAVLITDRIPLADYAEAIERFRAGAGRKVQVVPGRVR